MFDSIACFSLCSLVLAISSLSVCKRSQIFVKISWWLKQFLVRFRVTSITEWWVAISLHYAGNSLFSIGKIFLWSGAYNFRNGFLTKLHRSINWLMIHQADLTEDKLDNKPIPKVMIFPTSLSTPVNNIRLQPYFEGTSWWVSIFSRTPPPVSSPFLL